METDVNIKKSSDVPHYPRTRVGSDITTPHNTLIY